VRGGSRDVAAAFNTAALHLYEKLGYTTVWHRLRHHLPEQSPTDS
jgi:hypothetical protein